MVVKNVQVLKGMYLNQNKTDILLWNLMQLLLKSMALTFISADTNTVELSTENCDLSMIGWLKLLKDDDGLFCHAMLF